MKQQSNFLFAILFVCFIATTASLVGLVGCDDGNDPADFRTVEFPNGDGSPYDGDDAEEGGSDSTEVESDVLADQVEDSTEVEVIDPCEEWMWLVGTWQCCNQDLENCSWSDWIVYFSEDKGECVVVGENLTGGYEMPVTFEKYELIPPDKMKYYTEGPNYYSECFKN